jgi:hypothetical protein
MADHGFTGKTSSAVRDRPKLTNDKKETTNDQSQVRNT